MCRADRHMRRLALVLALVSLGATAPEPKRIYLVPVKMTRTLELVIEAESEDAARAALQKGVIAGQVNVGAPEWTIIGVPREVK